MAVVSVSTCRNTSVIPQRYCGVWWARLDGSTVDWSWIWSLERGWRKQWDNECG